MGDKKYYKKLDILRIIACAFVLLYHLNILNGGFLAVCTFFTLSGYLGCISALKQEKFSIRKYYFNRIKKLYIPLLIIVAITVVISKLTPSINWLNLKQETTSVFLGYNNFWQLDANLDYFTRHVNSPFMHLWYIAILMQFDLVFPIVFMLFKKIGKVVGKYFSTVAVAILTIISTILFFYMSKTQDIMVVYYNTFARSFSIIFGILIALIQFKNSFKINKTLKNFSNLIVFIYIVILTLLCIFVKSDSSLFAIFMIIATIITGRIIRYSVFTRKRRIEKITTLDKIIAYFAKISYEVYLVQYPIIFFMQNKLVDNSIKPVVIILLTIIIACIIHAVLNIKAKHVGKIIKNVIIAIVIIIGLLVVVIEEDHTAEMKELENRLEENLKKIEERNNEYLESEKKNQEELSAALANIESEEAKVETIVKNLPVVGVGDSVMLGASDGLYEMFPNGYFDGKVSRSVIKSKEVFQDLADRGKLTDIIITALANNSDYFEWSFDAILDIIGDRQIYWVTATYADDPQFNEKFRPYAEAHPNIHLVEWEEISKDHPEYFYADGIHLKGEGITAYAQAIYEAIYDDYIKEYKDKKEKVLKEHNEQQKEKIAFYGDEVITNSFSDIKEKFDTAVFNIDSEVDIDKVYNQIKEKVDNKTVENKLVFIYDKKSKISKEDYDRIVKLCSEKSKVYICNMTQDSLELKNNNVKVIDFYSEIKNNPDYLLSDKIHLSEKGSKKLAEVLEENIK